MRNNLWSIWCHAVVACYSTSMRTARGTPLACLSVAFVLAALISDPQSRESNPSTLDMHGPMHTIGLALPELPSLTHMQEAEVLAQKLSAGFGVKLPVAVEFSDWILEASARQRMQPELIASLVFAESSFRKYAQSHVGAVGPAQVRPHYWGEFCGKADLYDPEQNIYCGSQVLGFLLERCDGEQRCALSAYNIGMNSKRFAAGLRYVDKIDRHMQALKTVSL